MRHQQQSSRRFWSCEATPLMVRVTALLHTISRRAAIPARKARKTSVARTCVLSASPLADASSKATWHDSAPKVRKRLRPALTTRKSLLLSGALSARSTAATSSLSFPCREASSPGFSASTASARTAASRTISSGGMLEDLNDSGQCLSYSSSPGATSEPVGLPRSSGTNCVHALGSPRTLPGIEIVAPHPNPPRGSRTCCQRLESWTASGSDRPGAQPALPPSSGSSVARPPRAARGSPS